MAPRPERRRSAGLRACMALRVERRPGGVKFHDIPYTLSSRHPLHFRFAPFPSSQLVFGTERRTVKGASLGAACVPSTVLLSVPTLELQGKGAGHSGLEHLLGS